MLLSSNEPHGATLQSIRSATINEQIQHCGDKKRCPVKYKTYLQRTVHTYKTDCAVY